MKLRSPILFSVFAAALIFGAAYFPFPFTDNSEKEAVLIRTMINGLDQLHFKPQTINDDFSKKVYELYLERIDGGKRWLTQSDAHKLELFKTLIDDEVSAGTYEFFEIALALLEKGVEKTQNWYREILDQPFNFEKVEHVQLDGDKKAYAKDEEELRDYWRKSLKYEILTRVQSELEKQEKKGEEGEKKSFEELEKEARAEVLETYDNWYDRIAKLKRSDRLSNYLNVITNVYDPHTGYFEPIEKQNFDIRMSGRFQGIGARLVSKGDETEVSEIIVGGPVWKQKELEEGDIILKVRQAGEKEALDIKGMVINDVVQHIRGDKGTTVILTIRKKSGEEKEISIMRDIVIVEEGFARSLILDGKNEEKIGYIYLPRFYADFQDKNGRFCSADVAEEIKKLKKENVNGIVLDLRNNGGGSLRDVVKMTGLFIEEGPIVQVKSRGRKPEVLEDVNESVLYGGPLLVMVNRLSASASEILAAALQDYGRAVIVGSTSTFGKGTVQRFFDLDRAIRGYQEVKPLGQVKLTTQKFYRVNGGSTQLKGVVPDIVLPDNYHYIETGEKEHEHPLQWTEIESVSHGQNVYQLKRLGILSDNSERRVATNPTFQKVLENARRVKEQRDRSDYPLNFDDYNALKATQSKKAKQFENLFEEVVNPDVRNLEVDLPAIHADESKEARNTDWIESVQKDVYIKECLNIMHDLISMK